MTQQRVPVLSLSVIALWWAYGIWTAVASPTLIPAQFSDLVLSIAIRKTIVLIAIGILLRLDGDGLQRLGFTSPQWLAHIRRGIVYAVPVFIGIDVVLTTVLGSLISRSSPGAVGAITTFFRDPVHLLAWIPVGVIGGGCVEELERAFVLTRFEKWFGTPGLYVALVVSSVVFGVAHLYQGVSGAIAAGVSGLVFGLVYLRRRSGLEAAACHAFADVLGVIAATLLAK